MKQIVKNFNNFIKNTIFKVQNKTNNKFKISNFNKFLISFIGLLFLYVFYLLIPNIYEKNWVKDNIQIKLLSEFKINLKSIENISYRILPAPHFLIKDSNILTNSSSSDKSIGNIKDLKIFLSQMNFFDRRKLNIKKVIIKNANFSLQGSDLKNLYDSTRHKFSNKKILINKSNIFFKDNLDEIVSIIKVDKANLFFSDKELQNQLNLKGNAFAIPFTFKMKSKNDTTIERFFSLKAKSLNLNIINNHITKKDKSIVGSNTISFLNSTIDTEYKLIDENIIFISKNSKINNSRIDYNGELTINPFDLDLNIDLSLSKISKLFNPNSVLIEFFKSGLLFNENISLNTSITIDSNRRESFFEDVKIYLNILNSNINFDGTKFINENIGSLKLDDSNLFFQNNKLTLNTNLFFYIKNSDSLFSFLNTNKRARKEIKNIYANIDYDFSNNEIKFNKIKIDNNELNNNEMNILEGFNDNDKNNLIKTRRLLNELFSAYEG